MCVSCDDEAVAFHNMSHGDGLVTGRRAVRSAVLALLLLAPIYIGQGCLLLFFCCCAVSYWRHCYFNSVCHVFCLVTYWKSWKSSLASCCRWNLPSVRRITDVASNQWKWLDALGSNIDVAAHVITRWCLVEVGNDSKSYSKRSWVFGIFEINLVFMMH